MRLRSLLFVVALAPVLTACGDDPTNTWDVIVDTVTLYSASRPAFIGRPSALDLSASFNAPVPVETPGATGRWDVVLIDGNGTLSLLPASAFSLDSRAGIATIGNRVLEEVTSAPSDTTLFARSAVPMQLGTVYVVRTRRVDCGGISGVHYAKFEPIQIDVPNGVLRFRSIVNPFCNNRSLVPSK
jgi:hypothetical protein